MVISCSKTAPVTSFTARTQTELPFGGAAMNRVSTPPSGDGESRAHVGQGRRAGAIVDDQLPVGMGAALEADADAVQERQPASTWYGQSGGGAIKAEEPHPGRLQGRERKARDEGPSAKSLPRCRASRPSPLIAVRKPNPPRQPRSNASGALLAARLVAASVGVRDRADRGERQDPRCSSVVVTEGDQLAMRFTPKCGCSGKSRPEGRMTSIQGAPARLRA